jgi:hypothetical protein
VAQEMTQWLIMKSSSFSSSMSSWRWLAINNPSDLEDWMKSAYHPRI